jgi:hypothetical protein
MSEIHSTHGLDAVKGLQELRECRKVHRERVSKRLVGRATIQNSAKNWNAVLIYFLHDCKELGITKIARSPFLDAGQPTRLYSNHMMTMITT